MHTDVPRRGIRSLRWWCSLGAILVLTTTLMSSPAEAQTFILEACKKADARQIQAGSMLQVSQCGRQFTTADPYIVLVIHLRNIRQTTIVEAELLDAEQASVARFGGVISLPVGQDVYYSDVWIYRFLPVATDLPALARENPNALFLGLDVTGKPARERPGEWTFRVRTNQGPTAVLKFTLQAVPGTVAPSPTPAPSPEPSPAG